ncbi:GntR family transcriptional regulator [Microbacterium sp. 18062]|uniref:GntR family transcriptional regulator n=1 Tax=Microbacterium sp. 18062 TaxID=2681410 RepID=UPI00190F58AF|nr:GntR family transcriptional regulator [Microbacterium sp. 18062]
MSIAEEIFELSPDRGASMRRTLAEQVAAELHRAVLQGEYPSGSWLRVQDIARQFQTSTMPVREALRRLEALGLVEISPHRGARIADLSITDLEDTHRTRALLEVELIRLAAAAFSPDDAERCRAALARHEAFLEAGDLDNARRAHSEFHFLMYRAASSRWLLRSVEPAWQNSERYRFASPADAGARQRAHAEHIGILVACEANDPSAAAEALRSHLEGALDRIRAAMSARTADQGVTA